MIIAFTAVMRMDDLSKALPRAALLVAGIVFGCWKCAIPLREANPHWLMFGLMLSWAGNIGAYLSKFIPGISIWNAAGVAIAANVAGQLGDIAEPAMKRGVGVKDSGATLPGHGGFCDRVDSTLFALPVIYAWLLAVAGKW